MKKSNLMVGLVFILIGVACLVLALSLDTRINDFLFWFAGAGIIPGLIMMVQYFYWAFPKNEARYAERLENQNIELQDERKQKLRDKSGRYAYIIGLAVIGLSIVIISVLGQLELISNFRFMVIFLYIYFIFQYIIGIIIFNYLNNKY